MVKIKVLYTNSLFILFFLLFITANQLFAQESAIKLGKNSIAKNEMFTITITVNDAELANYSNFPDIPGFIKANTRSSSSTTIVNGSVSSSESMEQNYVPQREGTFTLSPFTMQINGKPVRSAGTTITVVPPRDNQKQQEDLWSYDPFEDFFGSQSTPKEFLDVKEDAFFGLSTSKNEVYVGEGFNVTLSFYVADNNRADLQFYNLGPQLTEILKTLKPANCWEENFGIEQVQPKEVIINNKLYTEFKIYQASFFPLNNQPVKLPAIGLKMIKYRIAKDPAFFGQRQADYKVFYTKPKTIKVKDLPPHPLKDKVAVGKYRLSEVVSKTNANTGQSVSYDFKIKGEGNIAAVQPPQLPEDAETNIEFYPPIVRQSVERFNGKVAGEKVFQYMFVPREPGKLPLGKYFTWIYFNTDKGRYDTLRANVVMNIQGESRRNASVSQHGRDAFYKLIDKESNDLVNVGQRQTLMRYVANVMLVLMLFAGVFLVYRKHLPF